MPIGWAITVVVLCVAVAILSIVVLGLLRQITPVLERAASLGEFSPLSGPAVGSQLPHFAAEGPDGLVTAEQLRGAPVLLLFLSVGCGPCHDLAEELSRADIGDLAPQLVVVTGAGGLRELGLPAGLRVLTETDSEVRGALSVTSSPLVIGVSPDGIVRSVDPVNTVGQLRGLASVAA
jgi:hypothetical protein